ncbi:MAG: metallophosphoesterase, partial [Elusimicrobia bacterium]|nr:metallophosphoesterase [Elusimicrobiota bacterium]
MTLAAPHPSWRRLEPLAAPWRTSRQLEHLKPRLESQAYEFAILGDVEPCRFRLLRLVFNRPRVFVRQLRAIQEGPAAFCVQLGDMVGRGSPRYYGRFLEELARTGVHKPYLTVIGNHDRSRPNGPSDSSLYRHLFGPSNYSFDLGAARFVVLDTSYHRLRPAQLRWLRHVLETRLRKIVFTHMGPVQLGLWGGSIAHAHGGFSWGAREFTELAAAKGVDRVYVGHVHAFGVQDYLGVRYVLTGGGGSALFPSGTPDRFHHYLTVSVEPGGIRERVHPLEGRSF